MTESTTAARPSRPVSVAEAGPVIPRWIIGDLPSQHDGRPITWIATPAGVIAEDGGLIGAHDGPVDVQLRAELEGATVASAATTVLVTSTEALSYVIRGGNLFRGEDLLSAPGSPRADALHLAIREGCGWMPLNNGRAVCYVSLTAAPGEGRGEQIGAPALFRTAQGSLGVVASADESFEHVYVWLADDTGVFRDQRTLVVDRPGAAVRRPRLIFDAASDRYLLLWTDEDDGSFVSAFGSLDHGAAAESTKPRDAHVEQPIVDAPPAAVASELHVFPITRAEHDLLAGAYGPLRSIAVDPVRVTLADGAINLPATVTVRYADGSQKTLGVTWDADELSAASALPGTHEVTGRVQQDDHAYPFIAERADPHIFYNPDDEHYYATGSYYDPGCGPVCDVYTSYGAIGVRRATTIAGLRDAPEHLLKRSKPGERWAGYFWAPEFHKINGTWYIVVGAHDYGDEGRNPGTPYLGVSSTVLIPFRGDTDDVRAGRMVDAEYWGDDAQIRVLEGAPAFDTSYLLDDDGQGYWVLPIGLTIGIARAVTAPGAHPAIDGPVSIIKGVEWPWEYGVEHGSITAENPDGTPQPVIEGPYVVSHGDYHHLTYSAATVDRFYCIGTLRAPRGSNLLDPHSWIHDPAPALMAYDTAEGTIGGAGHVGGGHNSMLVDEHGNLVLVYHARPFPDPNADAPGNGGLWDPSRHTAVKAVNVRSGGALALDVAPDDELAPPLRTIRATVTVNAGTAASAPSSRD